MKSFTDSEIVCVSTLVYYSVLNNAPLVAPEVWQWQMDKSGERTNVSLYSILQALCSLQKRSIVYEHNGFYTLSPAREFLYKTRMDSIIETGKKWDMFKKKAFFVPYIPFVRSIRGTGSLALATTDVASDLDISICTVRNRMWIVRASILSTAHMLGVRRSDTHSKNKLCFNHFLSVSNEHIDTRMSPRSVRIFERTLFHVRHQSALFWDNNEAPSLPFVMRRSVLLLFLKSICERTLVLLRLDVLLERLVSTLQVRHLRRNSLYAQEIPHPSRTSSHLVFSYSKMEQQEEQFLTALQSVLSGV